MIALVLALCLYATVPVPVIMAYGDLYGPLPVCQPTQSFETVELPSGRLMVCTIIVRVDCSIVRLCV